jgi:hypothetical protein
MIHKLKTLGLATVAVLAMSAFVASAAQAEFTANSYPTTFTGTSEVGNDVIIVDGSSIECAGHYEGTASEASVTVTLEVDWKTCKAFGFASAEVEMNGCHVELHFENPFKWSIACTLFGIIKFRAGNCEVQIGPQGPLGSVNLSNNGNHVDMLANVSGITANITKDGFLCPLSGTGHKSATFVQEEAVTLEPVSGGTDITVD